MKVRRSLPTVKSQALGRRQLKKIATIDKWKMINTNLRAVP